LGGAIVVGAVCVALLIAIGGPAQAPDTLARGDDWLDELRAPRRIIAHRIDERAIKAEHALDGWKSVEKVEFEPGSPEFKALAALFARGFLSQPRVPEERCPFNADFGLEFIRREGKRTAIFSFGCGQLRGDSGIRGYEHQQLGRFAASLFPRAEVFQRVSRGEPPYPAEP
jgi:hypothetical protein